VTSEFAEAPPHPAPRSSRGQALLPLKGEKDRGRRCERLTALISIAIMGSVNAMGGGLSNTFTDLSTDLANSGQ
jgi:hypothetical protein